MAAHARGPGRRAQLRSSAAADMVRLWIDDALELLWSMPESCSLDVADRLAGRTAPLDEVARHLGVTAERARQELRPAVIKWLAAKRRRATSLDDVAMAAVVAVKSAKSRGL